MLGISKSVMLVLVFGVWGLIGAAAVIGVHEAAGGASVGASPQALQRLQPPSLLRVQERFQVVQGKACPLLKVPACSGYLVRHAGGVCPKQPTCCGNNVCDQGENAVNCPRDCSTRIEPKNGCSKVAPPACKGRLMFPRDPAGACPGAPQCCGNAQCDSLESARSCPEDCGGSAARQEKGYCPEIVVPRCTGVLIYPMIPRGQCTRQPTCCGNGACEGEETGLNCPKDCQGAKVEGASRRFSQKHSDRYRTGTTGAAVLIQRNVSIAPVFQLD